VFAAAKKNISDYSCQYTDNAGIQLSNDDARLEFLFFSFS
jgi:hypothetical protein